MLLADFDGKIKEGYIAKHVAKFCKHDGCNETKVEERANFEAEMIW